MFFLKTISQKRLAPRSLTLESLLVCCLPSFLPLPSYPLPCLFFFSLPPSFLSSFLCLSDDNCLERLLQPEMTSTSVSLSVCKGILMTLVKKKIGKKTLNTNRVSLPGDKNSPQKEWCVFINKVFKGHLKIRALKMTAIYIPSGQMQEKNRPNVMWRGNCCLG